MSNLCAITSALADLARILAAGTVIKTLDLITHIQQRIRNR